MSDSRVRILVIPALAGVCLVGGWGALLATGDKFSANVVWLAGVVLLGAPVVWRTLRHALRGHFATDIVATMAIVTSVMFAQPLAGLIVVLMQTGGEALERFAEGRASQAVRRLEEDSPRQAHRVAQGGLRDIAAGDIVPGDRLLIRPGEMIPCDGVVTSGASHVDTSRLTGEAIPISALAGTSLMSGWLNIEGSLEIRASATSQESQYAAVRWNN
jgi:cation transport ATPase